MWLQVAQRRNWQGLLRNKNCRAKVAYSSVYTVIPSCL